MIAGVCWRETVFPEARCAKKGDLLMFQHDHFEHTWMFAEKPVCICGKNEYNVRGFKRLGFIRRIFRFISKLKNKPIQNQWAN